MIVAVVGMTSEARLIAGPDVRVIVSGGRPFASELAQAFEPDVSGILSFGVCGALDPDLRAGDLVIGQAVHANTERLACDGAWTTRLVRHLPGARIGDIAGADAMLATPASKAALRCATNAAAVDMESHIAATWARRRGIPFAVLRAVSDRADHALPRSAQAGLRPDGEADGPAVLRVLARHPWELAALIRTAVGATAGLRALRNARRLLGPRLGRPDILEHRLDMR